MTTHQKQFNDLKKYYSKTSKELSEKMSKLLKDLANVDSEKQFKDLLIEGSKIQDQLKVLETDFNQDSKILNSVERLMILFIFRKYSSTFDDFKEIKFKTLLEELFQ